MRLRLVRVSALVAVLAFVATACGGGGSSGGTPTGAPTASGSPTTGGNIVVGAEQWPQCLNPITSCSFATWTFINAIQPVLPKAVQWSRDGEPEATPLLTELPSEENGDIKPGPPFTVTFKLNPDANWADGTPITSEDFDFTRLAILNTRGATSTIGYDSITSIDTSDPKTVVMKFKDIWVDWPDVFGGNTGFLLEKHAFPKADPKAPDLSDEMQDLYTFSGGPWIMKSWDHTQEVLVRNDNYYGQIPYLDQVTIIRRSSQPTEINSILSGEVAAIYPQPSDVSLLQQFDTVPAVDSVGGDSTYTEALWFNLKAAPVDDPKVREAFAYAVDRQGVIDGVIKLNNPNATVQNCGVLLIAGTPFCQTTPFDKYTYQPTKAKQILEDDGYDCSGQFCQKNGKDLSWEYAITAGNTRRAATAAIVKEKAAAAGIDLQIHAYDATDFFSNHLPKLDYVMAEYASSFGYEPAGGLTATWGCDQIPTSANGYSGANTDAWCNKQADTIAKKVDVTLDTNDRATLVDQHSAIEAQDLPALPLFNLPNVSAWRTDKVAGPVGLWNQGTYGLFYNMEEWYAAKE